LGRVVVKDLAGASPGPRLSVAAGLCESGGNDEDHVGHLCPAIYEPLTTMRPLPPAPPA